MPNSPKITTLLNNAARYATSALRAPAGSSSKAQSAAEALQALSKAIANIDERLVALEQAQEKHSAKD